MALIVELQVMPVANNAKEYMLSKKCERIYQNVKGPVVPINIPFDKNFDIDFPCLEKYINFLCTSGIKTILLTYDSSEITNLTEKEVFDLTKSIADVNQKRAVFISSTPFWWLKKSMDYIHFAAETGVDAVKIQVNPRIRISEDELVNYVNTIAEQSSIPIFTWSGTKPGFSKPMIQKLAAIPKVVGIKNDSDPFDDYYNYIRNGSSDFVVMSGGQMRNFVFGYQFGSQAYLCTISPFLPEIGLKFYKNLCEYAYDSAVDIVCKYEEPLLALLKKSSPGWLQVIKTLLFLSGHFKTNLCRPPHPQQIPMGYKECRDYLKDIGFESAVKLAESNI